MSSEESQVLIELHAWQRQMQRPPSLLNRFARRVQIRLNTLLPERVHQAITGAIKQMVRGVLFGSQHTTSKPVTNASFAQREAAVRGQIRNYRTVATAEGAVTGAGGFLLGLADFPLLLSLKLKLLFDTAARYGYDVHDYTERLYLLYVFQLAFSSQHTRNATYRRLADWDAYRLTLPLDPNEFDWRTFQQEYRVMWNKKLHSNQCISSIYLFVQSCLKARGFPEQSRTLTSSDLSENLFAFL